MASKGYKAETAGWLTRDDGRVEAVRYYKADGSSFSGWIVRVVGDRFSYSDPIPNKNEAIQALLNWKV